MVKISSGHFTKRIQAIPKRNVKDVVGQGTGMRAIEANDLMHSTFGGGFSFFFFLFADHIKEIRFR